jgi:phosphoribosylaminoimidazole-succinocarboxamide synthase
LTNPNVYLGTSRPPGIEFLRAGKVRDLYRIDAERLLFVTTDRVSAFDVVMACGIPDKGRVLTSIATHWFARTKDILPNHLLSADVDDVPGLDAEWRDRLRGRVQIVRALEPTSVEWVVRGYLAGAGWKEYQHSGGLWGHALPAGLELASRLPEPLLTPTTKDEAKDLPLSTEEAVERVGPELFERAKAAALALYERGTDELAGEGILLADTKFEFGLDERGELHLIDEALTPDSSRFWTRDEWSPGTNPASFDKQILRDYLETLDWDKQPPPPEIDAEVLERVERRYREVCERITGSAPVGCAQR